MKDTFDIGLEQVVTVRKGGELVATVSHNLAKRTQVFSTCSEMGQDEIQKLLETLNGSQPTVAA